MLRYNPHGIRVRKARFHHMMQDLHGNLITGLLIAILTGVAIFMYLRGISACWLVLSLCGPLSVLLYWSRKALHPITTTDPNTVDGIISDHMLSYLGPRISIAAFANAIVRSDSNAFLSRRLGLPIDFLYTFAQNVPDGELENVWNDAVAISKDHRLDVVSVGSLTTALIKADPNHEQVLAKHKLSLDDIKSVVRWRELMHVIEHQMSEHHNTGGIARDWSFGYTPLLSKYGRNISIEIAAHGGRMMSLLLPSRQAIVGRMLTLLTSGSHRNATIVGPDGAGKTSVIHDFAELISTANPAVPSRLHFNQVYLLEPSALIAAAPGRGELEDLMQRILVEASVSRNSIVCLNDAHLFFTEGQGTVDISNIILPFIADSTVRLILTISEQALLEIAQRNPGLVNQLDRINIESASYEETMAALEDRTSQIEIDSGVLYTFQALTTAYRLGERYVHDLVQPGASFKLLAAAAEYSQGGLIDSRSVETAISESLGIKVGIAQDAEEKETLINLEELLRKKVIGQDTAVGAVANAIRRARAGVRNANRPIGAFLFLGPTGVGKTELTKALATVYYGGEENLIRVDMNQFANPESLADLTADAALNPTSLTAQAMKNPFSVVLLDEIEKAHSSVLASLLQVLDEGILRDSKSREVDFRDCIIVATSNAGADKIREHVMSGEPVEKFRDEFVNQLIDSHQFAPEFLNRFDEIVVFSPLDKSALQQIVEILIKGINKTLEPQKIRVLLTAEAIDKLVDVGYDPRLGARPLRRIIQKTVENQVATKLISGVTGAGDVINIPADAIVIQ
jgi:ATP-dependent Clp protease ATP-binding subunit ClpC